jgi:sulfite reductase (NADPH) flavoprotein alpha-component
MNAHAEFAAIVADRQPELTAEQWTQVEALARTVTAEQARWISGYFAGLDSGLLRGEGFAPAAAPQGRTLTILYGSETGNGRDLAKSLVATAKERGLAPKLADMADYKVRQIKDEQDLLIIVSTHGEGDPPEPAAPFFEFIESSRAPKLSGLRYSVLALGDSTYEHYCEAGKRLDRRLQELGAERMHDRADCDVDYDEPAAAWSGRLVERLSTDVETATARVVSLRPVAAPVVHDKRHPFAATVLENIAVVGRHSSKETRHVELDLSGSGLSYEPGDALGIVPSNDAQVVEQLLEATGLTGDEEVTVKSSSVSLASALTSRFEITAASPRFIEQWVRLNDAKQLAALAAPGAAAERTRFLDDHHVIDIVRRFPAAGVDAASLLAGLRPLQPRLYSLASSRKIVGEEAHITVAPVRYELHGTQRGGVASTHITDRLEMGATIPVYIQENPHFRLPADDVPIVMIGPGTGVAPFRAFLQEREARAATGRSWLFFGERNLRSDFLYQLEMQQWLKDGVLTELDVAFSRDTAEKVYVQHRMLERSRELFAWLEEGAHLYVCGDEQNMSRDVHEALIRLIGLEGDLSWEEAEDYVRRLSAEHRYQKDVY